MTPTVFHHPWWLDAVAGGQWEEATVALHGKVVARLPFVIDRVGAGQKTCTMPPLTHFLGPAIDEGSGSDVNRALKRAHITRDLIDRLPKTSGFYHKFTHTVRDTLVFQERGYRTSVQFTHEIAPAAEDVLWRAMRDKTRNVIRRAQEVLQIAPLDDPAEFTAIYQTNLKARGLGSFYDPAMIAQLCGAAIGRAQGRILAARLPGGPVVAAIFCVWDATRMYYLLSTRAPDASNGAISALVWTAMRDSAARGLIFDFDGVPSGGSFAFFTGFGGVVQPRYIVSRFAATHRLVGRLMKPRRQTAETYQT